MGSQLSSERHYVTRRGSEKASSAYNSVPAGQVSGALNDGQIPLCALCLGIVTTTGGRACIVLGTH